MTVADVVAFIVSADDQELATVAGALIAKMERRWGQLQTLQMLDRIVKLGAAAREPESHGSRRGHPPSW